jgi:hypothetical protein
MPDCSGEPVVTTSCAFYILHARLRVQRAPGIPCALSSGQLTQNSDAPRRENAEVWLSQIRHRERSEAIQLCFASR